MQNFFAQEGNLGKEPELIDVPKEDGTATKKLKLSVRFPYAVKQANGDYEDTKGFWATVEMWGRQAETLNRLLKKGARVFVMGTLQDNSFVATKGEREGQTIAGFLITAKSIALSPLGIESVVYSNRKSPDAGSNQPQTSNHAMDVDESIPFEE